MTQSEQEPILTGTNAPVQAQQTPEGFLLIDKTDAASVSKFIFGLIINIALTRGSLMALNTALTKAFFPAIIWAIVGIGLSFLGWLMFVHRTVVVSRLAPGELLFRCYPLRLGEECSILFRRPLRWGFQMSQPGTITAKLCCHEVVTYRAGKSTGTERREIWNQVLLSQPIAPNTPLEFALQFQIPPQGPPSFEATSNRVRWEFGVWLKFPGLIQDDSVFSLLVEPEMFQ